MIVKWEFIQSLHLDPELCILNTRSVLMVYDMFNCLDWRGDGKMDDIAFQSLLQHATDLRVDQIYKIFDLFDLDGSGTVEFDEFYLLCCILTAVNDNQGKNFMYRNWRTCFEILDADGSGAVSKEEFETLGFLFNFNSHAISKIYEEFDVGGKDELDRNDFQLFVLAAIEVQNKMDKSQSNAMRYIGNQAGSWWNWMVNRLSFGH